MTIPDWISRSYLTGVTAAQLRWQLSDINVIKKNQAGTFARSEALMNEALVTPTPGQLYHIFQGYRTSTASEATPKSMDATCLQKIYHRFVKSAFYSEIHIQL